MNNTTKEIEAGKVDSVSLCTVEMDGKVTKSDDFVAILSKEDGSASITYNTDALTLGMALKLVAVEYTRCLSECSEEERTGWLHRRCRPGATRPAFLLSWPEP